jgi:hypothetical protein
VYKSLRLLLRMYLLRRVGMSKHLLPLSRWRKYLRGSFDMYHYPRRSSIFLVHRAYKMLRLMLRIYLLGRVGMC